MSVQAFREPAFPSATLEWDGGLPPESIRRPHPGMSLYHYFVGQVLAGTEFDSTNTPGTYREQAEAACDLAGAALAECEKRGF